MTKTAAQLMTDVKVVSKNIEDYTPVVGQKVIDNLKEMAAKFKDARVLHVNSTAYGGGVAEILHTLVPLMNDLGIDTTWKVIYGQDEFFNVTKAFHNALQGMDLDLTDEMIEIYKRYNQMNAKGFINDYDFIFIHDPQPAYLINLIDRKESKFISRVHIDLTNANEKYWSFVKPTLEKYDATIFTMEQYVKSGLDTKMLYIMPPCIDPLSPKNIPIPINEAREIVRKSQIDLNRPCILQVSRFDPWKDPLGVIDAYRKVKQQVPGIQLVLLGSMASDDPEGIDYLELTARHAGEDKDILLLHNLKGFQSREVNAFQVMADVIVQKSLREGFGLVVTEALWKGRPVVGANVGGIPMQVVEGQTGFLVNDVDQCAEACLKLLRDHELSDKLGRQAKEHVRENFLTTRNIRDYLTLMTKLS